MNPECTQEIKSNEHFGYSSYGYDEFSRFD
jgi:hypothetical protein